MHQPRRLASPILLVFAAACGSDPTGPRNDNTDTRTIKESPSFATDVVEIFTRRGCTAGNCHGGGSGGLTLRSTAQTSFANLVNVASASEANEILVIPNDADNSYLVKRLENRQNVGTRMPRGLAALDNIDLTNIKNWINTGAPNN